MSSNPPGFQPGNEWGRKAKLVSEAIRRSIKQDDAVRLRNGVERLMDAFGAGEPWALSMVMDRLEGKPAQAVTVSGDEDRPLINLVKMVVVRADAEANVIEHVPSVSVEHTAQLGQIESEQQLTVPIETKKISAAEADETGTHPHPLPVISA